MISNGLQPVKKILDRVAQPQNSSDVNGITISDENEEKLTFRTDKLSSLTKEQRKLVSKIYSIIRDALDNSTAESVIKKIEEELK